MVEKMRQFAKKCFSNSAKAKIVISTVTIGIVAIAAVTVTSMRKTLVINVDGESKILVTYKGTVKDVLQENGIIIDTKDRVQPSLETKLSKTETITLKRAIPVEIVANGVQVKLETSDNTIGEMLKNEKDTLKDQGIEFNEGVDEISPSLDSQLDSDVKIEIVKVETKDCTEREVINFETVVEKDGNLDSSVEKVKSEGANGEKEITYQVLYKDGVEVSRNVKSTRTVVEPQNKVIVKGTGTVYASRGGDSIPYKKKLNFQSTAYTSSGNALTATGTKPVRDPNGISTVAVDPSVIPLGSKVYVEGYGYAIAADTGGAIKGNILDIYLNSESECIAWGRRNVTVLVVAYPGEW